MLYSLGSDSPKIDPATYIADSAQLIGKVFIAAGASVWMGAVLRGDIEEISVGRNSNIQENSSLHTSKGMPLRIGENATIGHSVTLHSCTIGDNTLIGMGSTILDGAEIGPNSLVAAGSLVTPGQKFPANSFIIGSPALRKKELGPAAQQEILDNMSFYCHLATRYRKELRLITKEN